MKKLFSLALSAALLSLSTMLFAEGDAASADVKKQEETYALMAAAQEICPVTGMELGSMGKPHKAKSGERIVFLCCKNCVGKPIKKEAWQQIQKNLTEAQAICPITKKALPADAKSMVVEGRTVFVCCKECVDKVKAEPEKAFAVIDAQLKRHVEAEKPTTTNNLSTIRLRFHGAKSQASCGFP